MLLPKLKLGLLSDPGNADVPSIPDVDDGNEDYANGDNDDGLINLCRLFSRRTRHQMESC